MTRSSMRMTAHLGVLLLLVAFGATAMAASTTVTVVTWTGYTEGEPLDRWFNGGAGGYRVAPMYPYEAWTEPQWQHPDIDVRVMEIPGSFNEYLEKLQAMLVAGEPIAVIQMPFGNNVASFSQRGMSENLLPYLERSSVLSVEDFWPQAVQEASQGEGVLAGLPSMMRGGIWLAYNPVLFNEAGLATPDDGWDPGDVRQAARFLTRDTDGDGTNNQWGLDLTRAAWVPQLWGARYFNDDVTESLLTSSAYRDSLYWLYQLVFEDRSALRQEDMRVIGYPQFAFWEMRNMGMIFLSTHNTLYLNFSGMPREEIAAIPTSQIFPSSGEHQGIYWIMNSQLSQDQKDAAWTVLEALSSPKWAMDFLVNPSRNIPALQTAEMRDAMIQSSQAFGSGYIPEDKSLLVEVTANAYIQPHVGKVFTTNAFQIGNLAVYQIYSAADPVPIESTLEEAAERINELLKSEPWYPN